MVKQSLVSLGLLVPAVLAAPAPCGGGDCSSEMGHGLPPLPNFGGGDKGGFEIGGEKKGGLEIGGGLPPPPMPGKEEKKGGFEVSGEKKGGLDIGGGLPPPPMPGKEEKSGGFEVSGEKKGGLEIGGGLPPPPMLPPKQEENKGGLEISGEKKGGLEIGGGLPPPPMPAPLPEKSGEIQVGGGFSGPPFFGGLHKILFGGEASASGSLDIPDYWNTCMGEQSLPCDLSDIECKFFPSCKPSPTFPLPSHSIREFARRASPLSSPTRTRSVLRRTASLSTNASLHLPTSCSYMITDISS